VSPNLLLPVNSSFFSTYAASVAAYNNEVGVATLLTGGLNQVWGAIVDIPGRIQNSANTLADPFAPPILREQAVPELVVSTLELISMGVGVRVGGIEATVPSATTDSLQIARQYRSKFELTGEIDSAMSSELANLSTKKFLGKEGMVPDRVVLGASNATPNYLHIAESEGGIAFNLPKGVWNELTDGLHHEAGKALVWDVNKSFLEQQATLGVSRFDYVTADPIKDLLTNPGTFRADETRYLLMNSERFGYDLLDNSWIKK